MIRAEWSETVIEVTRGDDEALQISLTDEDGEAYDLTDYAVRFTAVGVTGQAASLSLDLSDGVTAPSETPGTILVSLERDSAVMAAVGLYRADIEIEAPEILGGWVRTVTKFWLDVEADAAG